MQKIKKLPPHEAQKIAAGEVVERPANIVKELIENALDAGATSITLYIENAGKKTIRVIDNGYGMSTQDAHACFEHHATSKIQSVEDLQTINTFGFRGEALSSIASVSTVTLITKQAESNEGIQLQLKYGSLIAESPISAVTGTDITIENLFENMPARKKFLKTRETEWRHIQQLFFAIALDYTNISFKLYSEKQLLFNCPATDCLKKRWFQLSDQETSNQLLSIEKSDISAGISLSGVISNAQYGKYDRSQIYFFVNNRWIKNYKLSRALINGYQNVLPVHQYPLGCIKITIDPTLIDVNIHPRKEEVQFLHEHKIVDAIKKTVTSTLESHISEKYRTQKNNTSYMQPPYNSQPTTKAPFISNANPAIFSPFNFDSFFDNKPKNITPKESFTTQQSNVSVETAPAVENSQIEIPHVQVIGIYNKTYILIEQEDGILFVDQHAAHERILYEQFKKQEKPATIQLLFPQTVEYSKEDLAILTPYLSLLCENGIIVELFSETKVIIKATPIQLKNCSISDLIQNCLIILYEEKKSAHEKITETFIKKLRADMACKAAIKAGDEISIEHAQKLMLDLDKTDNRFLCPHGRPTTWQIPKETIKKKFKRDYRSENK